MAVRPTQGSKLFFVTGTQNAGLPGTSALTGLANPPASALTAEEAAKERARVTGHTGSTTAAEYAALKTLSRDPYRDADDHRSIRHDVED